MRSKKVFFWDTGIRNALLGAFSTPTYTYDKVGNITRRGSVTMSYDAANQLNSYWSGGQLIPTAHDGAGNMTRHGDYTYAYDAAGRLTSVGRVGTGTIVRYLYDTAGLLVKRTEGSTTTAYHWGASATGSTLTRIDYTSSTTAYALFFTYDAMGHPLTVNRKVNGIATPYYYRVNNRGDVREIGDAAGAKVASYEYDPWGTITASWSATGQTLKDQNPFRYAGYLLDPTTGLYYLRSRWYSPTVARFLTPDSVSAEPGSPEGLNRYGYAAGNPTRFVDPQGRWGKSVHFSNTEYWARTMGFKHWPAHYIAAHDYAVDYMSDTKDSYSWHFAIAACGAKAIKLLNQARERGSLNSLGFGLHCVQDKYAHGWAAVISTPDWHDYPLDNPEGYKQARQATFHYLDAYIAVCGTDWAGHNKVQRGYR